MGEKIRIIDVPPGQAPDWVRKAWVGLEIPLAVQLSVTSSPQKNVPGRKLERLGGFQVRGKIAITLLSKKSPEAANWWRRNAPHVFSEVLVFKKDVCEVI